MAPLIYVGTTKVKPGKLASLRKQLSELVDFVETNEPRMIAFHLSPETLCHHATASSIDTL